MKTMLSLCVACTLAVVLGCSSGNPGGPGANNDNAPRPAPSVTPPVVPPGTPVNVLGEENTFVLDVPNLSTSVAQGETKQISIAVDRRRNFDQDVTVKFGTMPAGVTIAPESAVIRASEKEAKFSVRAANDAALGTHTIRVIGHPARGADATNDFKVSIDKR